MAEPPISDRATETGITIARVFDAPRERVWKEWTEPERFADWFGARGSWRATMFVGPGRHEIHGKGEYREVVEPDRLVFTVSAQPGRRPTATTVVFTDLGDARTEMVFEQRGRLPAEVYERAKEGWSSFFDRIAERLADA